ncbi:MAG: phage tail protein [Caulobacter sp.]|nr:phage tail protein [Caulobacter sp.]
MTEPYLGEIRMFGGNFAPVGWAMCDGQIVSIAENDALYTLLGTTYGGDGVNTFGLPDLRGRVATHQGSKNGQTYVMGQMTGVETVTLTTNQMPAHTHPFFAAGTAATVGTPTALTMISDQSPTGTVLNAYTPYNAANDQVPLTPNSTTPAGGGQPHDNMQPYLGINFIIATSGIFPSQN